MPRLARKKSSTGIYHVMIRGINRQNIFKDDGDRQKFIWILERYKQDCNFMIYGYCLMNNHVHLLIQEIDEPISEIMKRITISYVSHYNNKYKRIGHLFQERFRSEVVDSDAYLITVLRYIHQNPLKAGLVKSVDKYRWTSYHDYVNKPYIIDVDFVLDIYSPDRGKAIELFDKYSREINNDSCLEYDDKISLSDRELVEFLKKHGINIGSLQNLEKEKRNDYLRRIKRIEGVTIRQISRLTGLSKSLIGRA